MRCIRKTKEDELAEYGDTEEPEDPLSGVSKHWSDIIKLKDSDKLSHAIGKKLVKVQSKLKKTIKKPIEKKE